MTARKPSAAVQKRLQKLLGPKAYWEVRSMAPTPEQRAEFAAALPGLRASRDAARSAMEARRAELLKDPEYLRLKEAAAEADKAAQHAGGMACFKPISIGTHHGLFVSVAAQGDTWDEVLAAVEAQRGRS